MNSPISILDHGAVGDGNSVNTAAIQAAIDACSLLGGGIVILPPGRYMSGTLILRSGVELHLEEGAVLVASTEVDAYLVSPIYEGCANTTTYRGLIYAREATKIAITGEGKILGNDLSFWDIAPPGAPGRRYGRKDGRPMMGIFELCTEVKIEGIEFEKSPAYAMWMIDCQNVKIRNVRVRHNLEGPNTDGFHLSSCSHVQIGNCDFVTGDDSIAIDGNGRTPAHDIAITNCSFQTTTNMVRLYTGLDRWMSNPVRGVVRDILVKDCQVKDAACVLNIVAQNGNIFDVSVSALTLNQDYPGTALFFMTDRGGISGVRVSDVKGRANGAASIVGAKGDLIENIAIHNFDLQLHEVAKEYGNGLPDPIPYYSIYHKGPSNLYARNVEGLALEKITLRWPEGRPSVAAMDLKDVRNLRLGDFVAAGFSGEEESQSFTVHQWQRDERNPILPPGPTDFDIARCMNPFVVRQADEYFLFYAGSDAEGRHRICLATAKVGDLSSWTRHGPILELGPEGNFDEFWCVLPCVHRFGDRWHLYYTGRNANTDGGLQRFSGIGLAVSDDLLHWKRLSEAPVLRGDGFEQWPENKGVAGGARILEIPQENGQTLYRMHYTLTVGTPSENLLVDQAKYSVIAHSYDGISWFDKRVILGPRLDADYENAATIALNVWPTASGYRAIYAGIGTRFGAYSICEATSKDGLIWERGKPNENLALPPIGDSWESDMTEYPNIIEEDGKLRLFYCGNDYGSSGIGTAIAEKLVS